MKRSIWKRTAAALAFALCMGAALPAPAAGPGTAGAEGGPGAASADTAAEGGMNELTIRMVGDDLIHGIIYQTYQQADGTYNFDPLFTNMKSEIQAADIAIINQETIMVSDPAQIHDYPNFGTPESIGHAIVSAGFDVVAHATNHAMDQGASAVMNTIRFWKNNYPQIPYLGIHDSWEDSKIRYLDRNGIRVGFVNYTYGLNGIRRPAGMEYCVDLLTDGGIEAVGIQTVKSR